MVCSRTPTKIPLDQITKIAWVRVMVHILHNGGPIEKERIDSINCPGSEEVFWGNRNWVWWEQQKLEITGVYMPKKKVQEERE